MLSIPGITLVSFVLILRILMVRACVKLPVRACVKLPVRACVKLPVRACVKLPVWVGLG